MPSQQASLTLNGSEHRVLVVIVALVLLTIAAQSKADAPTVALAVRAGTPGIGADLDFALSSSINARLGYSAFKYDHAFNESDITYAGKFKLSMPSALLDWYAFHGGFHLSAGAVYNDTRVDVTARPTSGGTYTIDNAQYTSAQIGSVTGQLKFGYSVSPYAGFGWGNPAGSGSPWTFLFDLGVIYGGTPKVTLNAQCGTAAPPGGAICTQLQSSTLAEQQTLSGDVRNYKWYPVLNLGLSYRF